MISSVTSVPQTQPAVQSTSANQKSAQSKPQATPKDTVQVSSAAMAALQESMETSAQTAKEARNGDGQAQRLLAKEAAAKAAEVALQTNQGATKSLTEMA